jgi:hypothetical protein
LQRAMRVAGSFTDTDLVSNLFGGWGFDMICDKPAR